VRQSPGGGPRCAGFEPVLPTHHIIGHVVTGVVNEVQQRLRALGFAINGNEEYRSLCDRAVERGQQVAVRGGTYLVYRCGGGPELWVGRSENGDREASGGLTPFFHGEGIVRFGAEALERDTRYPMEGFVSGWVAPDGDSVAYPCSIVLSDAAAVAPRLRLPAVVDITCSALATTVCCFQDEDLFAHSGAGRMAPVSMIPICTFENQPAGKVLFNGKIRKAELKVNPDECGGQYWWLLIDTLGATLDVVVSPFRVTGEPTPGGIARVTATLVGRIRHS